MNAQTDVDMGSVEKTDGSNTAYQKLVLLIKDCFFKINKSVSMPRVMGEENSSVYNANGRDVFQPTEITGLATEENCRDKFLCIAFGQSLPQWHGRAF